MKRYLLITRRRIPHARHDDYAQLWDHVRTAVMQLGGRAWFFVSTHAADHFTEFVEWQSSAGIPIIEREPAATALAELNAAFPSEESSTWTEAIF